LATAISLRIIIPAARAATLFSSSARVMEGVLQLRVRRSKRLGRQRCEKIAIDYASFVALACSFILIKSVHKARRAI
jgi:hypothetical protein